MAISTYTPGDGALTGARILIAEDSAASRQFIVWCLERAGARVAAVENGQALLGALTVPDEKGATLIDPAPADVVLTDVEMPVLDGLAAVRLLRRLGSVIPIVALTARSGPEDVEDCIAAGCDAFSPKPVDADKLIALLASLLKRGRRADRSDVKRDSGDAKLRNAAPKLNSGDAKLRNADPRLDRGDAKPRSADPRPGSGEAELRNAGPNARSADPKLRSGDAKLRSELADDPDFAELLELFVGTLPTLVSNLEAALMGEQFEELGRLVHQIKGAGGSYGFPSLTEAARAVEAKIGAGADPAELEPEVARLIALCRAAARTPQGPQVPRRGASTPVTLRSILGAAR